MHDNADLSNNISRQSLTEEQSFTYNGDDLDR